MAPTESKILTNHLLVPAPLPAIISLPEFTDLFPRALQPSPLIRSLYRDLQGQRNAVLDSVAAEIDDEVKHGKALRRAIVKTRRDAEAHEHDDEVEIERIVSHLMIQTTSCQQPERVTSMTNRDFSFLFFSHALLASYHYHSPQPS